ncbi:Ribonuclease 3 [Vanrija pseudolonga]|uniref:Ribonuclease 3 n=1 Tax=Vanrija pseudolonga TaxID=143232 RepID=A0AAF0Y2S9_9TREE|nr:Ribonuclease 3 [Vanrija pseudolonga]
MKRWLTLVDELEDGEIEEDDDPYNGEVHGKSLNDARQSLDEQAVVWNTLSPNYTFEDAKTDLDTISPKKVRDKMQPKSPACRDGTCRCSPSLTKLENGTARPGELTHCGKCFCCNQRQARWVEKNIPIWDCHPPPRRRDFDDPSIYQRAFTHKSAVRNDFDKSYENDEFRGDGILEGEGKIQKLFTYLVRNTTLAKYARHYDLDLLIHTGPSDRDKAMAKKMKVQADVVEALIGATAVDRGRSRRKGGRAWADSFARDIVEPIGEWLRQQFEDGLLKA